MRLEKYMDEMCGDKHSKKKKKKKVDEGKTNWKNDPWKVRLDRISDNISPSESQFFYNKNQNHISLIGKQIATLQKAVEMLEKI